MGFRQPGHVSGFIMLDWGRGAWKGRGKGRLHQNKDTPYRAFPLKALNASVENTCMPVVLAWTAVAFLHTAICMHVFLMDCLGLWTCKQLRLGFESWSMIVNSSLSSFLLISIVLQKELLKKLWVVRKPLNIKFTKAVVSVDRWVRVSRVCGWAHWPWFWAGCDYLWTCFPDCHV